MGQPSFEEIEFYVEYGPDNSPKAVYYRDGVGCGYQSEAFSVDTPANELINYHLHHAWESHRMRMPEKCGKTLIDSDGVQHYCVLEKHNVSTRHRFEI